MKNRHYTFLRSLLPRYLCGIIVFLSYVHAQPSNNFAWPNVPRIGLGGGMVVCTIDAKNLTDYMNSYSASSQTITSWNIAGEFWVAPEFHLSADISLKIEYAYLLNSHKIDDPYSTGQLDFSYGVHMPSVIVQYMYIGRGYFLKFGGGVGYYFAVLDQKFPSYLGSSRSSASGIGLKLDASGQTPLSENVFLILGTGMRFSFIGKFHGGIFDVPPGSSRSVSMNFISLGVTLGFIYYF